ncbi:hypothetical protein BH09BAC6_BH09BAC6_35120 [soil metagenome]|jgi:hypothetical protein
MKRYYCLALGLCSTLLILLASSPASAQRGAHRSGAGRGPVHRGGVHYPAGHGYYRGGSFFRPGFGFYGYPRLGFHFSILPWGYYPFYWNSLWYYYYGGVFYRPYADGGYVVTAPPIGAFVPRLPDEAQPIRIDGIPYFEFGGVYYKDAINDKGKKGYVVVGKDGVLDTDKKDVGMMPPVPKIGDTAYQLPDGCRKVNLNWKTYFVSPENIYYQKENDANGATIYRVVSVPEDD